MPSGAVHYGQVKVRKATAVASKWVMLALSGPEVYKMVFEASVRGRFKLLTAKNPAEFQRRLRIVIPDLILLDSFPDDMWRDMLQISRRSAPQVPVLSLIDPESMETVSESALAGDFLIKPVAPGLLSRRIGDVLN